jgi:hypothetical protein
MAEISEIEFSDDVLVEPLALRQRKARGFCTCPMKKPDGSLETSDPDPCPVHPQHLQHSQDYLEAHGLLYYDDRRNRFVTWADAVEGMRQPRYAGASSKALVLFTWMNLVRLLEALCYPYRDTPVEITEQSAAALVEWAEQNFSPDVLRSLIGFARGGGTEALCKIFQTVARNAQERQAQERGAS